MSKHYPKGSFAIHNHIDHGAAGLTDEQLTAFFDSIEQSADPDLLFESMSLSELDDGYRADDADLDFMMLEAITSRRNRLDRTMKAFKRALTQSMNGTEIDVSDAEIGKPRKSGVAATMTARFPFSDGQSLSIIFHAPDNDPMKINMDDTLIAFRFLLNKTDVTNVVSPHNGRDISLKQTTMAVSNLVEKNSAKFQEKQSAAAERKAELDKLEQDLESETDKQAALADEIDAAEAELDDLKDRDQHFVGTKAAKDERIAKLKARIAGYKGAKAKGTGQDKVAIERATTVASIEALEGRERAKAISKAVKAEFKRIGVTVNAKLQTQKEPLLDVRVKEGNTPIPEQAQAIILSAAPHATVTGTHTYFVSAENWLKALSLGFDHDPAQKNDSMDQKATLPKHVDELFHDYPGWSYDNDLLVKARAELSEKGWTQFSDDNNDMAETLMDKVILSLRNKLFALGAEYTEGGSQFDKPWPLLVDGESIDLTAEVPYLQDGHWSSFSIKVAGGKHPFTAETDLNELASKVVSAARTAAAQAKSDNEPSHKPDGTKDDSEGVTGALTQGDKFTVDGMEYELTEVPNTPDGYIRANGGPLGAMGGEQWEGYERFKEATGQRIAQFEAPDKLDEKTEITDGAIKVWIANAVSSIQKNGKLVIDKADEKLWTWETSVSRPFAAKRLREAATSYSDNEKTSKYTFVLEESETTLKQVVVSTGAYNGTKGDVTLAYTELDSAKAEQTPEQNMDERLRAINPVYKAFVNHVLERGMPNVEKPFILNMEGHEKMAQTVKASSKGTVSLAIYDVKSRKVNGEQTEYANETLYELANFRGENASIKSKGTIEIELTDDNPIAKSLTKLGLLDSAKGSDQPATGKVGAEYFDYSQEGTETVKIAKYREAYKSVEYRHDSLTGGRPEEFKRQSVKEQLIERVNNLIKLHSPRAKEGSDDRHWRDHWIQRAYDTIKDWESVQDESDDVPDQRYEDGYSWESPKGTKTVKRMVRDDRDGAYRYMVSVEGMRFAEMWTEAQLEEEIEFDAKSLEYAKKQQEEADRKAAEQVQKDADFEARYHLEEYIESKGVNPAQAQKIRDALNKQVSFEKVFKPRIEHIREMVMDERRTIQSTSKGRRLVHPEGYFFGEDQTTKTAMDYAEFLIQKSKQAALQAKGNDRREGYKAVIEANPKAAQWIVNVFGEDAVQLDQEKAELINFLIGEIDDYSSPKLENNEAAFERFNAMGDDLDTDWLKLREAFQSEGSGEGSESKSQEVTESLTTLQRLTDGEVQDMDEFDKLLDEAANTLEEAGLMEKYDAELNAAADAFTALLERESEGV